MISSNNSKTHTYKINNVLYKFVDDKLISVNNYEYQKGNKIIVDKDEIEIKNDDFGNEYVFVNGNFLFVNGCIINSIITNRTEREIEVKQPLTIKVGYGKEFLLEDNIYLFIDKNSCRLYALRADKIRDKKKNEIISLKEKKMI